MMTELSFTKLDEQKFNEFLNTIYTHATFDHNTQGVINYFHLLAYMQKTFAPKIAANILEVIKVVEAPKEEPAKSVKEETSKKKG